MNCDRKYPTGSQQSGKKTRSLSILLAANNPDDVALFGNIISTLESDPVHRGTFTDLTCVNSMRAVREFFDGGHMCDVILFDLNLLDTRHEETVEHMKAYADKIPAIILAGTHHETIAIKALKSGFQDYLVKCDVTARHFYCAVHYAVERFKILKERDNLIADLHKAINQARTLRGLLPICMNCKKIRDDKGYWAQIEEYISAHSSATFTHGICPECARNTFGLIADTCNL